MRDQLRSTCDKHITSMRIEGTLTKWNDDRGFGFITPAPGGLEVFVHISAFPKDGRRPTVGERLTFEIEIERDGKKRAKNIYCPARSTIRAARKSVYRRRKERTGFLGRVIRLAIIIALAFYGYSQYSRRIPPQAVVAVPSSEQSAPPSPSFSCDGRVYCSQMNSCAEAIYFLRNCPKVEMDGDFDGAPCESQWCTGPFAK